MPKLVKKRSKKIGLPPGTLVHIGEWKSEKTRITAVEYDEGNFAESELTVPDGCYSFKPAPSVTWINVDGVHDKEVVGKLGDCFGLHPLVQEDILNTDQRPKV